MTETFRPIAVAGIVAASLLSLPLLGQAPAAGAKSPIPGFADGRGPTGPVEVTILSPKPDEVIPLAAEPAAPGPGPGSTTARKAEVAIHVAVKNFELFRDEATKSGQHVHIVLDHVKHFEQFDVGKAFVLKGLPKGTHTIRVFAARPWHEAIKEPQAFAVVTFHVGEKDGKETPLKGAPLLTTVTPQGKVKAPGGKVLFDFLVQGCRLAAEGTADGCQVRYRLDDKPEVTLTAPGPAVWDGVAPGKHRYVIALFRDGKLIPGPFNAPTVFFEAEGDAPAK